MFYLKAREAHFQGKQTFFQTRRAKTLPRRASLDGLSSRPWWRVSVQQLYQAASSFWSGGVDTTVLYLLSTAPLFS